MADRFDEILAEMRRDRAERDRRLDQTDELIRFVGELNRRSELVFQNVVRELREMRRETRASTREILARTADNADLMKAHTEGIYALIDRLQGGNGGAAPAT